MAGRRCEVTDVREVLRRLRAGEPERRIARELALSRNTVASYRRWAERTGLLTGGPAGPGDACRAAPPAPSASARRMNSPAWPAVPRPGGELRQQGVEGQAIFQLLVEQHGFAGSYSAVKRFLRRVDPPTPRATLRVETAPGDEAQVDFGSAGLLFDPDDGRVRRAWAFVMTLSYSRHQYVEFVFDQTVATWLPLPPRARSSGSAACRAGSCSTTSRPPSSRPCSTIRRSQRSYRELRRALRLPHRPLPPAHARAQGEGRAGRRPLRGAQLPRRPRVPRRPRRQRARAAAGVSRRPGAGPRHHQAAARSSCFETVERAALLPLPATPWALAIWKQAKLHPTATSSSTGAYYSAPHRLDRAAALGPGHQHAGPAASRCPRARREPPRARAPASDGPSPITCRPDKVHFLLADARRWCQEHARPRSAQPAPGSSPRSSAIARSIACASAQGVLRLAQRYGPTRLEAACARAHVRSASTATPR